MADREYGKAAEELDRSIALDPGLAVAWAARASARFGLGRVADAARDYEEALRLQPGLATPLYGLAECFRVLGDTRAGEMYARYAESTAADARPELQELARRRAAELGAR
jgi:tetratricopeptide (TPR) repeat protein